MTAIPPNGAASRSAAEATLEELLALDLLTLREHTERAGDSLDPDEHAARLRESLPSSIVCVVRRRDRLVAYAQLSRLDDACGFVRAFNIHPAHRTAAVTAELLRGLATIVRREGFAEVCSHVYKTNRLSLAFHRRLGFRVTQESAKAVELRATIDDLVKAPTLARMAAREARRGRAGQARADRT